MTFVAVYGTLRVGEGNWYHLLKDTSKHIGTFRIDGFKMVSNGCFPYVFQGEGAVTVDVFEVDNTTMSRLDRLEGYPVHYDRIEIDVDGKVAWIYVANLEKPYIKGLEAVPSGDWMDYRPEHRASHLKT